MSSTDSRRVSGWLSPDKSSIKPFGVAIDAPFAMLRGLLFARYHDYVINLVVSCRQASRDPWFSNVRKHRITKPPCDVIERFDLLCILGEPTRSNTCSL